MLTIEGETQPDFKICAFNKWLRCRSLSFKRPSGAVKGKLGVLRFCAANDVTKCDSSLIVPNLAEAARVREEFGIK